MLGGPRALGAAVADTPDDDAKASTPVATTNDLKNGMVLNLEGQLWSVVEFQHVKPGKGPAFVRTKLKSVTSGKVVDKTFNAGTKVETANVDKRTMQFLYNDGTDYVFMDPDTFVEGEHGFLGLIDALTDFPKPLVIAVNGQVADGVDLSWLWDVRFEEFGGIAVKASGERGTDLAVRLLYAEIEHELIHDPLDAIAACPPGRRRRTRVPGGTRRRGRPVPGCRPGCGTPSPRRSRSPSGSPG